MQWRAEPVAQSVEHVTFNHGVAGSSPAGLTNKTNNLGEKIGGSIFPKNRLGKTMGRHSLKPPQQGV
jgi:hypothetical protein